MSSLFDAKLSLTGRESLPLEDENSIDVNLPKFELSFSQKISRYELYLEDGITQTSQKTENAIDAVIASSIESEDKEKSIQLPSYFYKLQSFLPELQAMRKKFREEIESSLASLHQVSREQYKVNKALEHYHRRVSEYLTSVNEKEKLS